MSLGNFSQCLTLFLMLCAIAAYGVWTYKTAVSFTGDASYRGKILYFSLGLGLGSPVFYPFQGEIFLPLLLKAFLFWALWALAWVDWKCQLLPFSLLLVLSFLTALMNVDRLQEALFSAMLLGGGLFVLRIIFEKRLKRSALGGGDIWLALCAGSFIPWDALPLFCVCAGTSGALLGVWWRWSGCGALFPFGSILSILLWVWIVFDS